MRPHAWGRRLVATQVAVLLVMGLTVALTALLVGPPQFSAHMRQAGHAHTGALDHAEQAFRAAGAVSLLAGLGVALLVALAAAWSLNRNLARGVDALVDGAARVAGGDYDAPVHLPATAPELAQVADEFNRMAAQVADTEATRRRMLTDLGHELRTPLAATQVTLEGLQDGVLDFGPNTLEVLLHQNRRLTALAAGIAEVSRAEEGRVALDRRPIDLDAVVCASLDAVRPQCAAAGVDLESDLRAGAPLEIDAARLGQVLDNLLRNAVQHTRRGDAIRVTSTRTGTGVEVRVADTGVGVPVDALPHLFERFYRVDASRTRDGDGGTGVGLAIARALARAHGGTLEASSDGPGRGATFTLRLPAS